jgi:hypothetical protein
MTGQVDFSSTFSQIIGDHYDISNGGGQKSVYEFLADFQLFLIHMLLKHFKMSIAYEGT